MRGVFSLAPRDMLISYMCIVVVVVVVYTDDSAVWLFSIRPFFDRQPLAGRSDKYVAIN